MCRYIRRRSRITSTGSVVYLLAKERDAESRCGAGEPARSASCPISYRPGIHVRVDHPGGGVPTPLTDDDPRSIGPYRLRNRIGAGGMGVVYLGFDPEGRPAAVKVPHHGHVTNTEFRK